MEEKMNLFQKLQAIQTELKAPKNLYNSFGKYAYRNAESICEALKPLEKKYGVATIISDDINLIGDRFYVTSTVTLYDTDSTATISVSASARESHDKKGMDEAQITGATSSYARKYALNGMFLLDDTKDVDSEEYQEQAKAEPKSAPKKATKKADPKTEEKATAVEKFPNRNRFLRMCQVYQYDAKNICAELKLTGASSDADFIEACNYVENLKADDEQVNELRNSQAELPFEL